MANNLFTDAGYFIQLTRGHVAIVDYDDYLILSEFTWHACPACRHGKLRTVYAIRTVDTASGRGKTIQMHRQILGLSDPAVQCDHINGDGLDNRRQNLRICTQSQNQGNARKRTDNSSGFKGVSWHKHTKKWQARLFHDGKSVNLGLFSSPEEAAVAYDKAAVAKWGEFARTNGKGG